MTSFGPPSVLPSRDLTTQTQLSEVVISHQADSYTAIFLKSSPQEGPQQTYLLNSEPRSVSSTSPSPLSGQAPLASLWPSGILQVCYRYQLQCLSNSRIPVSLSELALVSCLSCLGGSDRSVPLGREEETRVLFTEFLILVIEIALSKELLAFAHIILWWAMD